jgi:hypothetical protein
MLSLHPVCKCTTSRSLQQCVRAQHADICNQCLQSAHAHHVDVCTKGLGTSYWLCVRSMLRLHLMCTCAAHWACTQYACVQHAEFAPSVHQGYVSALASVLRYRRIQSNSLTLAERSLYICWFCSYKSKMSLDPWISLDPNNCEEST